MSIENLFSRHCSFCGDPDHNISVCDSDLIPVIDRKMSEGFYAITQQGALLASREEDIKERFIVWATDMFHYKDLRVFIITTIGSPASGSNKRQYAEEIWNIYKTLTATATATATATVTVTTASVEEDAVADALNLVEDEVTWSIDRTPRRHSDVEMMPLPSIRAFRSERVRERRARDVMNYIPSPEFVSFVRNLMQELDTEADFIPFSESQENKKFNIALTLLDAVVADAVVADAVVCECAICLNSEISSTNIVTLNCEHQFCGDCIIGTLKTHKKTSELEPRCALCRANILKIETNSTDVLARIQEFCL